MLSSGVARVKLSRHVAALQLHADSVDTAQARLRPTKLDRFVAALPV